MSNIQEKKIIEEQKIPTEYLNIIYEFLDEKKYGAINLVIQKGKIVGCDILEKRREI